MGHKITQLMPFGVLLEPIEAHAPLQTLHLNDLRQHAKKEHLIVLRGFETFQNTLAFESYCEQWGTISLWPFGKTLELIEQSAPEDHIFDHRYVPLHWDGMYREQIPEFQVFHCIKAPLKNQGGKTLFSNTVLALKNTPPEIKMQWHQVTGTYQRKMAFYHSEIESPIITKHPYHDTLVIRYNEPHTIDKGDFINPSELHFSGISNDEIPHFHLSLQNTLYDPRHLYAHEWQSGDIVIADNFSLLHGREAFTSKAPRHIQRIHILSEPPFNNPGLKFHQ